MSQLESFPTAMKTLQTGRPVYKSSPTRQLSLFLDQEELIRVEGCLENADLSFD